MAKYIDAKCKLCRRAGEKLFLKGERCLSPKCAMVRRPYAPGMHGNKGGGRNISEYGRQLAMKQKIKRIYGVLEKQFRRHFREIQHKKGVTGDLLLIRLELRLDNVLYRAGFSDARSKARQIVGHGLIAVNGKRVDIPSYCVSVGDTISVRENKQDTKLYTAIKEALKSKKDVPAWMKLDAAKAIATVAAEPSRDDIDAQVNPQMVVEYYSK